MTNINQLFLCLLGEEVRPLIQL